jgi:hypothetical protein
MLTQREKDFIRYWEANRLRRKKVFRQFLIGIPIGLLFVIPIIINFSSGWYKRADMEAHSSDFNPMVLFVALLLIVGFTAIFYQRHQWDQYEQHYEELKARLENEESASAGPSPEHPASRAPTPPGETPISTNGARAPNPIPQNDSPGTPKSE